MIKQNFPSATTLLQAAYEAGRDCALNGANTTNCAFWLFATPELMKAWERGKNEAAKEPKPKYCNDPGCTYQFPHLHALPSKQEDVRDEAAKP